MFSSHNIWQRGSLAPPERGEKLERIIPHSAFDRPRDHPAANIHQTHAKEEIKILQIIIWNTYVTFE